MRAGLLDRYFHYRLPGVPVLGGEHPEALGRPEPLLGALRDAYGVSHALTLTPDPLVLREPVVTTSHVGVEDVPSLAQLERAAEIVAARRAGGDVVLVHCAHGCDRTGAVVAAVLVGEGLSVERAIEWVFAHWPARRHHPAWRDLWEPYAEVVRAFAGRDRPGGARR